MREKESFERFEKILPDILWLADHIHANAVEAYNKLHRDDGEIGKGGSLSIVTSNKSKEKRKLLTGVKTQYWLYDSAHFPIMAAYRSLITCNKGVMEWKIPFPRVEKFVNETLGPLVLKSNGYNKDRNLNSLGKNSNHWESLEDYIEKEIMRVELEALRSEKR
jgi:hypothetical protein